MKLHTLVKISLPLFVLPGCTVGPNFSPPATEASVTWKERSHSSRSADLPADWWRIFKDPDLNSIEEQAIEANNDLKRAVARVTEARALARATEADLYPNVSSGSSYSRIRQSENQAGIPMPDYTTDDFVKSFDLSYELDIWGKVRRSVEASNADARAVDNARDVVLLTLTADVARNYFLLRSLDAEREVIEATIASRRDAAGLQETRNKAGLENQVDETRARTELATVEADLHSVLRTRAQTEHALAVLCGRAPSEFNVAVHPLKSSPPDVPAGLPSSLLERRPDIAEAGEKMHSACARIGVAKAAFFPTIQLTGSAGFASADLSTLLNAKSKFLSAGPGIHVPVFEGGRNSANLKAAEAQYEQAYASYSGAVLVAFREVEDALSDLNTLASQIEAVKRAAAAARDTATLASERYSKGLSNYLDVVDAERSALEAERQESQLRGQRAISTILLVKALGGGWKGAGSPAAASDKSPQVALR